MLPFFAYHIIFLAYANIAYEASIRDIDKGEFPNSEQRLTNYICFILLICLSAYFLFLEFK